MTVGHVYPDRFDEVLATVGETFLPDARQHPGNRGFLLLASRDAAQVIEISFWESEADLQASGAPSGYYAQRMEAFIGMLVEPPTTTIHDVVRNEQ
jgi:heme-degrading monooxygenase HmoA